MCCLAHIVYTQIFCIFGTDVRFEEDAWLYCNALGFDVDIDRISI